MGENFNEAKGAGNTLLFFALIVSFLFKSLATKKVHCLLFQYFKNTNSIFL